MDDAEIPDEIKNTLATQPEAELDKGQSKLKRKLALKNKI